MAGAELHTLTDFDQHEWHSLLVPLTSSIFLKDLNNRWCLDSNQPFLSSVQRGKLRYKQALCL